jgi:ABC-2 type transport system ATP-binding protein
MQLTVNDSADVSLSSRIIRNGSDAVVRVNNLSKKYANTTAVNGISFELSKGEVFAFLGPNGAGKSSIVKMLTGLTRPDSGSLAVFGGSPLDPETRARVGFAPEDPDFPKYLRADEVLDYFGRLLGISAAERWKRIPEVLTWCSLADERRYVRHFPKGMKQRLGLAQAILGSPELLILHEPTADLDPVGRRDVRALINGLKERGTTVLLNSHLLSEVERVCDTLAIMSRGRILKQGPMDELVPEGRSLEEVFMQAVEATSTEAPLPAFIEERRS